MALKKISTKNAKHFYWGSNCDGWFLAEHPNASVIYESMLPNTSEIKHYHNKTWQFIFILSGTLTIEINNIQYELNALEGIEMPVVIPHNFHNRTNQNITYLLISAPNVEGDRINLIEE